MCIIIVQMYKKALTHEQPSGKRADEVEGEGVVVAGFFFLFWFFFSILVK